MTSRTALTIAMLLTTGRAVLAGPITSSTALPVAEGEWIIRGQTKFIRSTGDPGSMDRDLTVWAFPTVVVYGATGKFTLFGIVPYLDKELDATAAGDHLSRSTSGLGDVTVLARYTARKWDKRGETLRLAPFVGLKMPTGRDDASDSFGRLPRPLQLGSGSWDPIVGGIFTWQTLGSEFDASASYKLNTEANDFRFGDQARLDLSYQHRLLPRRLGAGVPSFLYGVVEANMLWQAENEASGTSDRDSGGTTLYLAPGIQYITKRFAVETAVQIPVIQDLNGGALENDYIVTAGFRVSF